MKKPLAIFATLLTIFVLSGCQSIGQRVAQVAESDECVVLLHGLWRSGFAMRQMDNYLIELGYQTERVSYPSTEFTIEKLSSDFLSPAIESCQQKTNGAVHIVAHSMGGIVARQYLQDHDLPEDGKLVLISTPNQGSELVQTFADWPLAEWILGPAAMQMKTEKGAWLETLKPVNADVGVIAGNKSYSLFVGFFLPKPHDGTVSVESTKLPEMQDFVQVSSNHVGIRSDEQVLTHVASFLKTGYFQQ